MSDDTDMRNRFAEQDGQVIKNLRATIAAQAKTIEMLRGVLTDCLDELDEYLPVAKEALAATKPAEKQF